MIIGRLTQHARRRMEERHVTEDQVNRVILKPDSAVPDPDKRSYRLERGLSEGTLKVWVKEPWPPTDRIVVKSVAWKRR